MTKKVVFFLLVPVGTCWYLWVLVGTCWYLLAPVGTCWHVLVPVGVIYHEPLNFIFSLVLALKKEIEKRVIFKR